MRSSTLRFAFWIVLVLFGLPGCSVLLATAEPFPTDTPTPTITPTRTIQWFPVSTTPTPWELPAGGPVLTPTLDQRPALGEVVLQDNFSDSTLWQTYDTAGGSAKISHGSLNLTAPELFANLVSLRHSPVPGDFFLEITGSTGLCRGKDSYGVVFRSDGGANQYRLIVSCDGYLRVERWRGSEVAVAQDWLPSTQIPQGGPQVLQLGVWMVGSEMRIFINGAYQFSTHDPVLDGKQVGVFLRSTGANAVSVSFSNLVIRGIQNYRPSPVPSPTPDVTLTPTRMPTNTPGKP
jgi:hypothetical protein